MSVRERLGIFVAQGEAVLQGGGMEVSVGAGHQEAGWWVAHTVQLAAIEQSNCLILLRTISYCQYCSTHFGVSAQNSCQD